ncbi:MAG TPA: SRPBCC family protein [Candidatus Dormibacteraeota bacterium]|nr:SRPBCC family protein [Candidatus Dormibacteraeota bacterium]
MTVNLVLSLVAFPLRMRAMRGSILRPRVVQVITWLAILSWVPTVILLWIAYETLHPGLGPFVLLAAGGWVALWSIPFMRGLRYRASITIRRPPEEVFDFMTDPSKWSRFTRTLVAQQLDAGPMKVGSIIASTAFVGGQSLDGREVVIEYQRPSTFALQLRGVSEVLTERTSITRSDGGVTVSVTFHTTGSFSAALMGARLNKWSLQKLMRKTKEGELGRLKEILEVEDAA